MIFAVDVARLCLRLCFLAALALGLAFWSGHALHDVPIHMAIGVIFVLALWTLGIFGLMTRVNLALSLLALGWGVLVLWLGIEQVHLVMSGHLSEMVKGLHFLAGIIAMGIGEPLGKRITAAGAPASA